MPLHPSEHAARTIPDADLTTLPGEGHLLAAHFPEIASRLIGG